MTFVRVSVFVICISLLLGCSGETAPSESDQSAPLVQQPAPPPPSPSPSGETIDSRWEESITIEEITADPMDALRELPIAYEVPEQAEVGRSFDVTLAIDATGDESAAEALPGFDRIIENSARLTDSVEASLSGSAFDIVLTNSARQRLSPVRESVWRWKVTPQQDGPQRLYLEIFALVGEAESVLLESFSDSISVDISPEAGESAVSANNIRTYISIIGVLISIILGLIALNAHLRKRPESTTSESDSARHELRIPT